MTQLHFPNPSVDRVNRGRILSKRVRALEKRLPVKDKSKQVKLEKKLSDYRIELQALNKGGG